MKRKSSVLLLTVAAFIYVISFIVFMKKTFQVSENSETNAERFLGLGAKRGGVKNISRFFLKTETLSVTKAANLHSLILLLKASDCREIPTHSEHFGNWWMNTTEARDEFVYSAYKDNATIRIVGATVVFRNDRSARFCKIWYKKKGDKYSAFIVQAKLSMIPEDHGTKFSAAYFICPLSGDQEPVAVSLSNQKHTSSCKEPILPVYDVKASNNDEKNFSVCVSPLNNNYSRAYELIEWIELNRILGVQYFTFYNYSVANNIGHVLSYYTKRGIVEVLPWNMPLSVKDPEEIHYYGQLAALNDCLYRNRHKTKYIAFIDIDEFIIPKRDDDYTWSEMLKHLPSVSSYGFRNVFFRRNLDSLQPGSDYNKAARKYRLITLAKVRRDKFIFPMFWRSKLIVNPKKVETIGIHNIWEFKPGEEFSDTLTIAEDIGLLHHYRFWNSTETSSESVVDRGALKYKEELIKNVQQVWSDLQNVEMGPPPDWV